MVLCAGWLRQPLFKHLGRLVGRAFEVSFFVRTLLLVRLLGPGALEDVHVFCDEWSCGGALARLPLEPVTGLRRRLGAEGARCLLSSFSLLEGGATAI